MSTPSGPSDQRSVGHKANNHLGEIVVCGDLAQLSTVMQEAGLALDFSALLALSANFLEAVEGRIVLSLEHFDVPDPNNLLFLSGDKAILYSKAPPTPEALQGLGKLFSKPYGKSTALAFLVLKGTVANYKAKLESLIAGTRDLEQQFDVQKHRNLVLEFERLFDRLEDLHEILIKLEETTLKEVETRYISFDYKVLLAEASNLLDRCRNRFNMLKDLARDHEMQVTSELNRRIERLNEVVKRLTAVTVILMVPTLIASHFGMNFAYMPELRVPWAYPAVVIAQVVLVVAGVVVFRRIGWL
ncbi:MAG: magnesium transporter CorA family protein [Chloroflexi bacterium]|nr:magnesium transporter CorA family protein [Chloroflexota bacterium]